MKIVWFRGPDGPEVLEVIEPVVFGPAQVQGAGAALAWLVEHAVVTEGLQGAYLGLRRRPIRMSRAARHECEAKDLLADSETWTGTTFPRRRVL